MRAVCSIIDSCPLDSGAVGEAGVGIGDPSGAALGGGLAGALGGALLRREVVSVRWTIPDSDSATSSRRAFSGGISAPLRIASSWRLPSMLRMKASSVGSDVISCSRSTGSGLREITWPAERSSAAFCRASS